MTWMEVFELLDGEIRKTLSPLQGKGKVFEDGPANDPYENETEKGVDLACAYFAENRKWPHFKPVLARKVFRRIAIAREFARFVACPEHKEKHPANMPQLRDSDSEMLRWILIDYYWKAGFWRSIYCLSALDE